MKFYQAGRGRSRAREQGLGGKIWRIEFSVRVIHAPLALPQPAGVAAAHEEVPA